MTIRLGLQINNFSYGTGVAELFPTVIAQAQEADAAGFDSVFVMDHFYQLPGIGTHDQPMLEAYTALGALATATENVQLGTLGHRQHLPQPDAAGQGHHHAGRHQRRPRHPRASAPAGSSSNTTSSDTSSAPSPTVSTSWAKRCRSSCRCSPASGPPFTGKYYRTQEALANPRFREHIPLMIGGSGEKKTIPLAAQHFDHLNVIAGFDELATKGRGRQAALRGHRPRPGHAGDQHARRRRGRRRASPPT